MLPQVVNGTRVTINAVPELMYMYVSIRVLYRETQSQPHLSTQMKPCFFLFSFFGSSLKFQDVADLMSAASCINGTFFAHETCHVISSHKM